MRLGAALADLLDAAPAAAVDPAGRRVHPFSKHQQVPEHVRLGAVGARRVRARARPPRRHRVLDQLRAVLEHDVAVHERDHVQHEPCQNYAKLSATMSIQAVAVQRSAFVATRCSL